MKVVTLLENTTISKDYKCIHGLSLYIETSKHKILFDTGSNDYFIDNAKKLGVNLRDVDIAVISHGHSDHGGGIEEFLKVNDKAKIYISSNAFDNHLVKLFRIFKINIGLKKELMDNKRIIKVNEITKIDDELTLFSKVSQSILIPPGNKKLLKQDIDGNIIQDDFNHELNLLINERNTYSLVCGCAHKGIVNIVNEAENLVNVDIKTVIGGFHLMGIDFKSSEGKKFIDELVTKLKSNSVQEYYTCHCTGEKAYRLLSNNMNNLKDLKTGAIIDI